MDAQRWRTRSNSTINSVVRELCSRLLVREKFWNPSGKLAFKNGTLDTNYGIFSSIHKHDDYLTKVKPYNFLEIHTEPN